MTRMLIWKDYCMNKPIIFIGLFFAVFPFIALPGFMVVWNWPSTPQSAAWSAVLRQAATVSLGLSLLTQVLLGGNLIAAERADRSAEFLAYLPPSRFRVLASKAIVAFGVVGTIWVWNLAALFVAGALSDSSIRMPELPSIWVFAAVGSLLLGGAWIGSSVLQSAASAAALGIGLCFVAMMVTSAVFSLAGLMPNGEATTAYFVVNFLLGAAFFLIGSAFYVKNVSFNG